MDMPKPVDHQCVKQHIVSALAAAEKEAERSMKEAAAALRAVAQPEPTPPGIEVSFDGSWSQRGFTAAYGYRTAVSIRSGKVLDYHVASKVCPECAVWDRKDPEHTSDRWKAAA